MDSPRAAVVRKEIAYIGGGKATVMIEPDKLKTAKTVGKKRKALEDLPVVGASKDVNLKQKSTRKGNEVKKNQMTKRKQSKSVLQGFGNGNKLFDHISIDEIKQHSVLAHFRHIHNDEEIKKCYEWAEEEEIRGDSPDNEENFFKKLNISKMVIPGSEYTRGEPFKIEEKAYERDELDFKISFPERHSSDYTIEELEISGVMTTIFLDEFDPLQELKLNEDF